MDVEVPAKGNGRGKKNLFYKLLNYFPIVVRPRNNGHKFCFFLCSSLSLPSYLVYLTERAVNWERAASRIMSRRPDSIPSPAHVLDPMSEKLRRKFGFPRLETEPAKESEVKVMENGILGAIMKS